ncbi:aspartyl/asparaginyl beta-hydroxylase domain-containing protein [Sphingomonas oligophenolica]
MAILSDIAQRQARSLVVPQRQACAPLTSEAIEREPPLRADPGRPFLIKYGKHLRGVCDWLIARCSLISTEPVLNVGDFPWTALLRDNWEAIRDEAVAAALEKPSPSLANISPDHRAIAAVDKWRSFFLWGYGYLIQENLGQCPVTTSVMARIPGLNTAFFSILAPGTHIPPHRGVTKGLITCHLGLIIPQKGDVGMRVRDRIVHWSDGGVLVFDDTFDHEVWNDTDGTRVVLLLQVRRPLKQPGKWFVDKFLAWISGSAFVQEALANLLSWNAAIKALETDMSS